MSKKIFLTRKKIKIKLRKGDKVVVISGKDKGKIGVIEKIIAKKNKAVVPGVNQYKKHQKPKSKEEKGGIIIINKPILIDKLALVCPKCQKPTRIGFKFDKQNQKFRFCKKCKQFI